MVEIPHACHVISQLTISPSLSLPYLEQRVVGFYVSTPDEILETRIRMCVSICDGETLEKIATQTETSKRVEIVTKALEWLRKEGQWDPGSGASVSEWAEDIAKELG